MFTYTPINPTNKPMVYAPKNIDIKSKLQFMGKDTSELDRKVEQEIQEAKSMKKTFNDLQESFKKANETFPDRSQEENYVGILNAYKNKGYSIEGVNIDEELAAFGIQEPTVGAGIDSTTTEDNQVAEKKNKSALSVYAGGAINKLKEGGSSVLGGTKNVAGGAVSQVPSIIGNTFGFLSDVLTPKEYEGLGDVFREGGIRDKDNLQKMLGVDPDTFSTKAGEFGSEILSLFIPGGQSKLISKFPQAADKINDLSKIVTNIQEKAPKVYNVLSSSAIGAKEAGKFSVVSEGELSITDVAIGAAANPAIDKSSKLIKSAVKSEPVSNLIKAISPKAPKGVGKGNVATNIRENVAIVVGDIKDMGKDLATKSIKSLEDLLNVSKKNMDDIYTKNINPALEQSSYKVNIKQISDDILEEISGKQGDISKASLIGKSDQKESVAKIAQEWSKIGDSTSIQSIEDYKRLLSFTLRASDEKIYGDSLTSLEYQFLDKMNKKLQSEIDTALEKTLGEGGATALKRKYAAYSNLISDMDMKLVREAKKNNVSLFEGLGIISGATNILEGIMTGNTQKITGGATSIATGKVLNLMRDPDQLVQKAIKNLFKTEKGIGSKVTGGISSQAGQYLDESVNQ